MKSRTKTAISPLAIASLGLAAVLLAAGGCAWATGQVPGGRQASLDMFTYRSTEFMPQTVTLMDTRDLQPLWSSDVPVGYELRVRFVRNYDTENVRLPDTMRWAIVPAKASGRVLSNQIPCPPHGSRRLDVAVRSTPEDHGDLAPPSATAGVPTP